METGIVSPIVLQQIEMVKGWVLTATNRVLMRVYTTYGHKEML